MARVAQATNSIEMNENSKNNDSASSSLSYGSATDQTSNGVRDGEVRFELSDSVISLTDITLEEAVTKIKEIEQANFLLRDYMRNNNDDMKRQHESLKMLKLKEKEKFEQTKAVITALREENQEMQVKVLHQDETVNKLKGSLTFAEEENARLQLLVKAQNTKQVSEAEDQMDTVYVTEESQENLITELKNTIASKEDCILLLQTDLSKHKEEIQKYQESTKQLLLDLESQQSIKVSTDEENRRLNQQLVELNTKLYEQMHINVLSSKRELQSNNVKSSLDPSKRTAAATDPNAWSMLQPETVDDLLERAQSMDETIGEAEKMKALLEKEKSEKQVLEMSIQDLTEKVKELIQQNNQAMEKLSTLEREKSEEIKQLCQDYEAKLTEKSRQHADNQYQEPINTEDVNVMKHQIMSLFNEITETQGKLDNSFRTIQHKDEKINMLNQTIEGIEKRHLFLSHHNQMINQELDNNKKDNLVVRQQLSALQVSFDKLATDYGVVFDHMESFKVQADMAKREQEKYQKRRSSENMEELNHLTAQVFAAEEAIALKDDELKTLHNKFSKLQVQVEVLSIQAETYKGDFDSEREARTKLVHERDEILKALKDCQVENQALKEEQREVNMGRITELQRQFRQHSQDATPPRHGQEEGKGGADAEPHYVNEMGPVNVRPYPPVLMQGQVSGLQQHTGQLAYQPPLYWQGQRPPRDPIQNARHFGGQFQTWDYQDPVRISEEEVGDNAMNSLIQYDCPSCNTPFPDIDTLNLHVPDCIDGDVKSTSVQLNLCNEEEERMGEENEYNIPTC